MTIQDVLDALAPFEPVVLVLMAVSVALAVADFAVRWVRGDGRDVL